MRPDGIVEDGGGVVPVEQERRVEQQRGPGEKRDRQPRYDGLREVNRQRAAPQPKHQPFPRERSRGTVDELAHRPTREKDEKLRRVGKRYVAKGEALEKIAGNVINEDREKSEPAPKVDLIGFAHVGFLYGPFFITRSRRSPPERDNTDAAPNIACARPAPKVFPRGHACSALAGAYMMRCNMAMRICVSPKVRLDCILTGRLKPTPFAGLWFERRC